MLKVLLVGIVLCAIGEFANITDATAFGTILIAIAIIWPIVKAFSGSGGSCGGGGGGSYDAGSNSTGLFYNDPYGFNELPYEYNGKRFRTWEEKERYRETIRDATIYCDPRFR